MHVFWFYRVCMVLLLPMYILVLLSDFFWETVVCTQDFVLVRQAFCQPFFVLGISEMGLMNYL
jgi:hypothetical protein